MASEHAPRIPEVTAHLVGAGGKRLRPLLTLAAARMCGYEGDDHIRLAATVEFIHTATLLHDDVVDESRQRRGRPTANLLWDNKSSVLVGDYLFARAFRLMVETGSLRVLEILSDAAATIAEGEVLQLTASRSIATDAAPTCRIVRGKTAALFAAACEVGGVIAGRPEAEVDGAPPLRRRARHRVPDRGRPARLSRRRRATRQERRRRLPRAQADAAGDPRGGRPPTRDERAFWRRAVEAGDQREGDSREALRTDGAARHARRDRGRGAALGRARAEDAMRELPEHPLRAPLIGLADYVVEPPFLNRRRRVEHARRAHPPAGMLAPRARPPQPSPPHRSGTGRRRRCPTPTSGRAGTRRSRPAPHGASAITGASASPAASRSLRWRASHCAASSALRQRRDGPGHRRARPRSPAPRRPRAVETGTPGLHQHHAAGRAAAAAAPAARRRPASAPAARRGRPARPRRAPGASGGGASRRGPRCRAAPPRRQRSRRRARPPTGSALSSEIATDTPASRAARSARFSAPDGNRARQRARRRRATCASPAAHLAPCRRRPRRPRGCRAGDSRPASGR